MGKIAWIVSIGTFLAALALGAERAVPHADLLARSLYAVAAFTFPPLWENALTRGMLDGRQRAMACLALLLALPLVLLR